MLPKTRLLFAPVILTMCNTGYPSLTKRPPPPAIAAAVAKPAALATTAPVAKPSAPAPTAPIAVPTLAASPATNPAAPACIDRVTAPRADGGQDRCYPYLCRAGACLTRCADRSDCAGAQLPADLPTMGWPLECQPSGECTPMDPDKVH